MRLFAIFSALLLLAGSAASAAVRCAWDANSPSGAVDFELQRKPTGMDWPANPLVITRGKGEVIGQTSRSSGGVRATRADYDVFATADFFVPTDVGKELVIGALVVPIATVKDARHVVIGATSLGTITTPTLFSVRTDRVRHTDETVTAGAWTYRCRAFVGTRFSGYSDEVVAEVGPNDPSGMDVEIDLGGIANMSTRGTVAGGEASLIAGFALTREATVLVRAVGPSLAPHGISEPIARPRLRLMRGAEEIVRNEGWADDPVLAKAAQATGAFPLAAGSRDAALLIRLGPGLYTAICEPVDGSTGIGLAEVYRVN